MKILIWVIVAVVIVAGLAWFLSSDAAESSDALEEQNPSGVDQLSENGRIIDSDKKVLEEIDESMLELE